MKLVVVAVGKIKDKHLRAVADDYKQRLGRYVRVEELEVKDGAALERAVPADSLRVALEVHGDALGSETLARRVERWGSQGKGVVAFFIGGAEGLPAELSRGADARLSLSSLTLPHRLARVVLFEQLYRAMTILRGEPYARED
ncbi:MAG: 23S rRNA (pseudouridine(1915)-N(3))-methyltransferase RlmH [Myxococcales bacterium]|nr:23S rRNA (pseudouridine(1915)-N(3))-methyltransferase RlmH [Myxococcales bacterium]MCB9580567.1 23S rRNA (pseudouridine(1915)-N(3))-methyltransferase RlmH [Polyangiaceae bacterium]